MMRTLLLTFALGLAAVLPAAADDPPSAPRPSLKAEVNVTSELVRIGDLIDYAGDAADIPIFRAPDLGTTGAVPAPRVVEAARAHGLTGIETHGLAEVSVTRQTREISLKEIEEQVTATLAGSQGLGEAADLTVTFDRNTLPLHVEPAAGNLRIRRASYDRYSNRFDVTVEVPGSAAVKRQRLRYTGTVTETIAVATPLRPFARGDLIRTNDVIVERQPKNTVPAGAFARTEDVVGMAASRALRPGQPMRAADVMKPELVLKNDAVTILYEQPGLMLTVRGKALDSGAEGDVVSVLNVQSKRTLQGVVAGPGRVTVVSTFASTPAPEVTGSVAARRPPQRIE